MNFLFTRLLSPWRNSKQVAGQKSLLVAILMVALSALMAGCSGGGAAPAATGGGGSATVNGYTITLRASQNTIQNDEIDSATITATVIKDFVAQANVVVTFSTTAGLMSNKTLVTGADGKASITLTASSSDSNQLINVSAISSGASVSIPLQIIGNTITLSGPASIATTTSQTLTATVKNSNGAGIYPATVTFTLLSGSGVVSLSRTLSNTNANGDALVTVNGLIPGTATIQASCNGEVKLFDVTVAAQAQVFEITAPATDPTSLSTGTNVTAPLTVTVKAPPPITNVTFHTTIGVWNGGITNSVNVIVAGGFASATFSSATAGTATITTWDTDDQADATTKDSTTVNISAPAAAASQIILQPSATNLGTTPTGSTTRNSVTITANVLTADGQVVGNSPVNFSLDFAPGGGEYISPGTVYTDSFGQATTTFYSGSRESTGDGVRVIATIPSLTSSYVDITITGRPGSIAIGRSNKIIPGADNTYYEQDIRATVTDNTGKAVANTPISFSLWPTHYYLGTAKFDAQNACIGYYANYVDLTVAPYVPKCPASAFELPTAVPNEDLDKDLILDPGEDIGPWNINSGAFKADDYLTPHNATAGTLIMANPSMTTDANGEATFKIRYLKQYAMWVKVALKASINVQGTETSAEMNWQLEASLDDYNACQLFPSPFGYFAPLTCP